MSPHGTPDAEIYRWVDALVADLGVEAGAVDVEAVLDLARETAAGVGRPAVPLTAFLVGCAVGARGGGRATFDGLAEHVAGLARTWSPEGPA